MKDKIIRLDGIPFVSKMMEEGDDSIFIEGYASTSSVDRADHTIMPSAWSNGLREYLKNPVLLAFHDHTNPVGKTVDHRVDSNGLWIKGRVSAAAEKVYKLVRDEIISAFSVAFMIKDAEYNPDADVLVIKELELYEISLVSVGMNRNTLFSLSKSFENDDEFKQFKMSYASPDAITKDEIEMTKEEIQALVLEASKKGAEELLAKQAAQKAEQDRIAADEAKIQARIEKAIADVKVGDSGAEKLLAEIEKRFSDERESNKSMLEGLQAEIKEKAEELQALQKSKMRFDDSSSKDVNYQDKETAVLLAKVARKGVHETSFGKNLIEKVGPHVASATWELEVSMNMESEVRRRLVVAPTLRSIPMRTNVMTIPINPEAGHATWITNAQFGTTASTGSAQTHQLGEVTLNAYKVATLEYVNFEEEEDSLLALLPTIRDGMIRRLARAVDLAFLRGAGAGTDPVKGLAKYDAVSAVQQSIAGGPATVAQMLLLRKDLGAWGLDPSELRYVVSTDVYYDLLADDDFKTVDLVGDRATLLTGQIGSIGNTPVLVSAEFDTKANLAIGGICYAPANFVVGNQRGMRMDTDNLVETQRQVLVASMRTGMTQLTTNLGGGVSAFQWTT